MNIITAMRARGLSFKEEMELKGEMPCLMSISIIADFARQCIKKVEINVLDGPALARHYALTQGQPFNLVDPAFLGEIYYFLEEEPSQEDDEFIIYLHSNACYIRVLGFVRTMSGSFLLKLLRGAELCIPAPV